MQRLRDVAPTFVVKGNWDFGYRWLRPPRATLKILCIMRP